MNLAELRLLVVQGEGQHLEFKKKADFPDKIVRELVAFANSEGGRLFIGVDDQGRLSGLKYPDEELYVMEAAMAMYARPQLPVSVEKIAIGSGLFVLHFQVRANGEKPFFWLEGKIDKKWWAYVRSKDQSIKASKELFYILKNQARMEMQQEPFRMSDMEQRLIRILGDRESITKDELAPLLEISRSKLSNRLINWVLSGVLEVEPFEQADRYRLSKAYRWLESNPSS